MRNLFVLVLWCSVLACGGHEGSSGASGSPTRAALQDALRELTRAGMPGVGVWIDGPRGAEYLSSGVADVARNTRPRQMLHYRIGSISKAFSAAVILSLIRDGALDLNDTVGRWLPGRVPQGEGITVRQLLNHTSGLFSYTDDQTFLAEFAADLFRKWTPDELLGFAIVHPLNFAPGTSYEYSNTDNLVVGLIVEAVTERPYSDALEMRVIARLDLQATSYPTTPALPDPFLHGYVPDGDALEDVSEAFDPSGLGFSGAIVSTVGDVARFMSGVLDGELYGRGLLAEAMQTVPGSSDYPGPGVNHAGLGIFRYELACGDVWGHTGRLPGYSNFAAASADGSRTVVVWVNEEVPSDALRARTLQVQEMAACRALTR